MIAELHPPDERHPDLTLTITMQRPTQQEPDGYIRMTAQTNGPEGPRMEDAADGPHSEGTIVKVFEDALSYFRHGRKSWAAMHHRGREGGHERLSFSSLIHGRAENTISGQFQAHFHCHMNTPHHQSAEQ